jgi:DNA-binding LytR/AlgR family response regulator
VFSDIQMPGEMDGVGLAQWLATHHPDIPAVLTSGAPYAIALATARVCGGEVRRGEAL